MPIIVFDVLVQCVCVLCGCVSSSFLSIFCGFFLFFVFYVSLVSSVFAIIGWWRIFIHIIKVFLTTIVFA